MRREWPCWYSATGMIRALPPYPDRLPADAIAAGNGRRPTTRAATDGAARATSDGVGNAYSPAAGCLAAAASIMDLSSPLPCSSSVMSQPPTNSPPM